MNPTRFNEYALSSSLMIVRIGMLSGLWDLLAAKSALCWLIFVGTLSPV